MLNKQLIEQIEQEAKAEAGKLTGRVPIFRMGYESGHYDGATQYALLWQAAEQRADRYEKALKDFANRLNEHCGQQGIYSAGIHNIIDEMMMFPLTNKSRTDE